MANCEIVAVMGMSMSVVLMVGELEAEGHVRRPWCEVPMHHPLAWHPGKDYGLAAMFGCTGAYVADIMPEHPRLLTTPISCPPNSWGDSDYFAARRLEIAEAAKTYGHVQHFAGEEHWWDVLAEAAKIKANDSERDVWFRILFDN